jgi:hypothetical protein
MSTVGRKTCRSGRRCEVRSLSEAVDCVAHHSDLPLREIAERIGKGENYLRSACSQYDDSHKFQAELIIPITASTQNFAILDYLERAVGRVAIRLPDQASRGDVFERTADLARELGHAVEEIWQALADGHVSNDEAERVRLEIHHLQTAAAALEACVLSQVEKQPDLRRVS